MILNMSTGPRIIHFRRRIVEFVPRGPIFWIMGPTSLGRGSRGSPMRENRLDGRSSKVISARIYVGLNVGDNPKWSVSDVVSVVVSVRLRQIGSAGASILGQRGIYKESRVKKLVVEDSAQVLVMNREGVPVETFVGHMKTLANALRSRLDQDEVLLEIQDKGVLIRSFTSFRKPKVRR